MSTAFTRSTVKRLAGLELNALLYSETLPKHIFQGARIRSSGTPIYDVSGERLFYRIPVMRGRTQVAYADIAANPALGSPLLAVHQGLEWNARALLDQAISVARKRHERTEFTRVRFVAYSYPKLAVQFLKGQKETLMLELYTWRLVPPKRKREPKEPPSNFERWSLIEELPAARKRKNMESFQKRVSEWNRISPLAERKYSELLHPLEFEQVMVGITLPITIDSYELHYSLESGDHNPCYELRGQQTYVWCVAASVQMFLDFYRYNYQQTRIAQELDLGTIDDPNGLPYSRDGDVVTALEDLTGNALNANMNTNPNWAEFRNEIKANRPIISFVPGHSRTVAGYTSTKLFGWYVFRGLLVYDPWPPATGVITRWENFDIQTYRRTFTAQLTLA